MQTSLSRRVQQGCRGTAFTSSRPTRVSLLSGSRCNPVRVNAFDPHHAVVAVSSIADLHLAAAHHANLLSTVADGADQAVEAVTTTATAVAGAGVRSNPGPFDALAVAFEKVLEFLDDLLVKANVPYSYGFAIILLTVLVKLATFPLSQKQVASTVALQALQPRVKELQAKHANDTETLNLETARLYKEAGVNPLAGCLPTLATIPVFIGLYRALTLAAEDNLLNDPFFWIPSLGGPATLAMQQDGTGMSWLFPFVDGHPPIGWETAGAYLVMPVLLVASQYASQRIISPPSTDPAQAQSQAILKFLPLMIGWFSLNVPAGLTLYWFVNNIFSTAQQVYLKSTTKINIPGEAATAGASTSGNVIASGSTPYIAPKEEKVKRIAGKDVNARRKRRDGSAEGDDDVVDIQAEVLPSTSNGQASSSSQGKKGKGEGFRAKKAREAAAKAAASATTMTPTTAPPAVTASAGSNGSSGGSENGSKQE